MLRLDKVRLGMGKARLRLGWLVSSEMDLIPCGPVVSPT